MKRLVTLTVISTLWTVSAMAEEEPSLWEKTKQLGGEIVEEGRKLTNGEDAQEAEPTEDSEGPSQLDQVKEQAGEIYEKAVGTKSSRDNRRDSVFTLAWLPVSPGLWLPKSGFLAGFLLNESWTVEPQYLSGGLSLKIGKVDLVEFKESLLLLPVRYYPGNSFSLRMGIGLRSYSFGLGDDMLSRIAASAAGEDIPSLNALEVSNTIVHFGLGNRWQLDNGITLGVDWFDLFVTVGQGEVVDKITPFVTDKTDRDNIKKTISILRYSPTISALTFHIGYTF